MLNWLNTKPGRWVHDGDQKRLRAVIRMMPMPIHPDQKALYPDDWPEIRLSILRRAGDKCERCGVANYSAHPKTGAHVVLTIMHLDHDPRNNRLDNLQAACQRCHNQYDAPKRARNRKRRLRKKLDQIQRRLL